MSDDENFDEPDIFSFMRQGAEGATKEVESQEAKATVKRQDASLALEDLLSLQAKVEAIIFAAPKPMKAVEILEVLQDEAITSRQVMGVLDALCEEYEAKGGGFKLEHLKGLGYQFRTVSAAAPLMEKMFASRPRPISRAALETLAIIAYRQPVTRAQIEFIRGVDAGSIIKNLLERDLIVCVGRKEDAGRPMLFGTTDEFLKVFRLESLKDLPPLESFQVRREVIEDALEKIDGVHAVDVEEFVGDREQDEATKVVGELGADLPEGSGEVDRSGTGAGERPADHSDGPPDRPEY